MPIQVSIRSEHDAETGPGYDLICGQGRLEAFMALGHKEIPAIVVEIQGGAADSQSGGKYRAALSAADGFDQ
jgi:ParB-like chromosome segregation protein Spo0J